MVTAFGNRYNSPLRTVGATSTTINEVLTNPHTIYIKGENPDSTNGNIVDLENQQENLYMMKVMFFHTK
jgi:hypothetical protein